MRRSAYRRSGECRSGEEREGEDRTEKVRWGGGEGKGKTKEEIKITLRNTQVSLSDKVFQGLGMWVGRFS